MRHSPLVPAGADPADADPDARISLARVQIARTHAIKRELPQFKALEHLLIEKIEQRIPDMLSTAIQSRFKRGVGLRPAGSERVASPDPAPDAINFKDCMRLSLIFFRQRQRNLFPQRELSGSSQG